ncbi:interferon-induced GTP-binding protein MxC isoform X2 [Danio rerio]|uniref:Interferon-induced GTP-binding protein MxC n=7 Tax=Danio rerio TaxID=7955 RepID=MXC_DANRE|nr:interferon-induced GTP-binding protein MxC [Danio rerio]XP_005167728.1 interferon-induced GTP-binding protein MxC isoform X1 [Danio rerio]Q6DKF0.1 RecName: Full=Interferon-induced GTP-binding protein MxC; AltName: Full=IFN-inducible antiviral protein MxC; AltName: Full=Interferon-inducible MxC protein [Danio rerio]AAH74099.1 Myxovirus (influenza virus) resistance C [Danio rerio]AAI65716.1 Mxc protein [Danio rerio]|eukprot:NP_001007285.1 interferon-induced GTP-binding protein MxC [Danio rerio]
MSSFDSAEGECNGLNQHYEKKVRPIIDLVDTLRALGVEKDLNLPAIAVIGDQSSGKSSVLEALSGVALPRGIGIVTRCPLILKLKKITRDKNWSGLLTYKDQTEILKEPTGIENAVLKAQIALAGTGEGISHEMITLEIQSCDVPDLTLIDLPGIARVATGNQPEDIEKQIKDLIEKFIKRQETISLVVVPANIDIATTEALKMASTVDPTGQRTLCILTKPDLVDRGMEDTVVRTVNNEVIRLEKGYMIVKCRGQQDINDKLNLVEALEKERRFFDEHPQFSSLLEDGKATIPLLGQRLTEELVEHIAKNVPRLQNQIEMKLQKTFERLKVLGESVPDDDEIELNNFLIKKLRQFMDALEEVKRVEEEPVKSDTRVFSKIRQEFVSWKHILDSKPIKMSTDLQEYVRTHRGKELPGFLNYGTFAGIIRMHVEDLEEPALKLLRNAKDIVHSSVGSIANIHFNGYPNLLLAVKEPIEKCLHEQFQNAEEKIRSQFKLEKTVYCQDDLYTNHLNLLRPKNTVRFGLEASLGNSELRETAFHLTSYLTIACERLANQIPLIVQYHMMNEYNSQLQNAMLGLIGTSDPGMLLCEDSGVARIRKDLKERLERLKDARRALPKVVHSANSW